MVRRAYLCRVAIQGSLSRASMCLYWDRMAAEHEFPAGEGQAREAQAGEGRDEAGRDAVDEHPPPRRRKRWRLGRSRP